MVISRNSKGKLVINTFKLDIFFGDLLDNCNNHSELEFVADNLQGCLEKAVDEKYEALEND